MDASITALYNGMLRTKRLILLAEIESRLEIAWYHIYRRGSLKCFLCGEMSVFCMHITLCTKGSFKAPGSELWGIRLKYGSVLVLLLHTEYGVLCKEYKISESITCGTAEHII